jgi:ubiquinone/menaquinone biosynthesis C-methylase UbiE
VPTAQEVRSWYNRRYASLGLDSMRPAEAYPPILELLEPRQRATLLDVSCGSGFLLKAARARGMAAYGVDLSDAAVRLAHQVAPESRVAVGAGEELCFRDASFDYITCLGSLEHFLDIGRGLQEMLRVAKPGALFCIMVPNRDFAGWKLLGHAGTAQQDINERLLSLGEWRALFEEQGLHVRRVVPDRWHAAKWRTDPRRRSPAYAAKGLLLEMAWSILPLSWEYQFIFLLERR